MAALQYFWLHLFILFLCSHKPLFSVNSMKPSMQFTYDRFPEVKQKCGPLLSSRSKLAPDDTRGWRVKDFHFANGDWSQDPGSTPLMPFQDIHSDYAGKEKAPNLASFQVVDVDRVHRMRDTVSVSGVLDLAISRGIIHLSRRYRRLSPEFDMQTGLSRLAILFEGIYAESEGEQLMCLLGTAKMPTDEQLFLDHPMEPMEALGKRYENQARGLNPSLVQDDRIMLVLRYPRAFTLTDRPIWGEMTSLSERSEARYFDRVSLSSQLMGDGLKYQFGAGELLKRACDPYPYRDESLEKEEELVLFGGDSFCDDLQQFVSNAVFDFVTSKEYDGSANKDQNSDPFGFGMDIEHLRVLIQDPRCHSRLDQSEMSVNISAVFRLIPSWENQETSKYRTGLNGTAVISAEGTWRSSSGQLCMIGCSVVPILSTPDHCNYIICLYMPRSFSLTRRSIVFGTISRIHGTEGQRPHHRSSLRFEMPDSRVTAEKYYCNAPNRSYKYTRILEASSFQKQRSPPVLEMLLRRSILQYPTINPSHRTSLSSLSNELCLNALDIPQVPFSLENRALIDLHILSLGSYFSWYPGDELKTEKSSGKHYLEKAIPVAGHLSISGGPYVENMSLSLAFEGVYDPSLGKMTLLACRRVLIADVNLSLQGGKDCLLEAEIEYPPRNFRWLWDPTVKIYITSKRITKDPLHFPPVDLSLPWVRFQHQFSDILYREKFEAALRIFLLSLSVLCIFSQLNYRAGSRYIGFLSLSMLGIQAIGYCLPFISGNEVLFKRSALSPSHGYHLQDTASFKLDLLGLLDSAVRVLVLVAFLLTLRLFQKVQNSRRSPNQMIRTPDEKRVLLSISAFHLAGFFIFTLVAEKLTPQVLFIQELQSRDYSGNNRHIQEPVPRLVRVDGYTGMVQDLFLLPQVFSNIRWKIDGKPLRKSFYTGLTIVRVMVRVYDYLRDPLPDYQPGLTIHYTTGFKVRARFWNIGMAVAAATLAVILHLQQQRKNSEGSDADSDNPNHKLL